MKTWTQNVPLSIPRTPTARLVGHDGPVQVIRFTADGKYCLTGGHDRTIRLWNPSRIDPAYPIQSNNNNNNNYSYNNHNAQTMTMDGYYGYYPTSSSNNLQNNNNDNNNYHYQQDIPLQDLPHALPIQKYADGITHPISALAIGESSTSSSSSSFSSSSQMIILAGTDKTLIVIDMMTQRILKRYQGHVGRINSVAISSSTTKQNLSTNNIFASASYDATVRLWDARNFNAHEPIQILKDAKDSVTCVQLVNNGNEKNNNDALIRTSSVDGMIRTYDIRKGILQVDDCTSPITNMVPTKDGHCLAISCLDGTIRLMDLDSGELLNTYHSFHKAGRYGLEVAITANDANILTGSEDGCCVVYDLVQATRVQSLTGHTKPTCSIAAHPTDSSVVLTASYDGSAVVWANHYYYTSPWDK